MAVVFSTTIVIAVECNSRKVRNPAAGETCGAGSPCPGWSGAGSCETEDTYVEQPLQRHCTDGTMSTYCHENGSEYACTKIYNCVHGTIPNPDYTGEPDSPYVLDVCEQGGFIRNGSTRKLGVGVAPCEEPGGW